MVHGLMDVWSMIPGFKFLVFSPLSHGLKVCGPIMYGPWSHGIMVLGP